MAGRMTVFGVGPRFALGSAAFSLIAVLVQRTFLGSWRVTFPGAVPAGVIVMLAGLYVFVRALVQIQRAFREKRLETQGVYGMCRHPLYAAFIVFIVPGSCLIIGTLPGYAVPVFMYFWFTHLIRGEDDWLEQEFGEAYTLYRKRVPAVLPLIGRAG